jgi:hypothetical protein
MHLNLTILATKLHHRALKSKALVSVVITIGVNS